MNHNDVPQSEKTALRFIIVTLFIDFMGFGIVIPIFPKLLAEMTGGSLSVASQYGGWLMFSYAIVQFFSAPVLGNLGDRFGRRPVLLISMFGLGANYLLLAYAPDLVWLFSGRIIAGITGASFTTGMAYIADISPPERRAQNFGLIGAAFGAGFIIGPVIGGLTSGLWDLGHRSPFLVAAFFSLLNWVFGWLMVPESLAPENRRAFDWKKANPVGSFFYLRQRPQLAGFLTAVLLIFIGNHSSESTWAFITMTKFGWGEREVGFSLGAVGVMMVIVQGWLVRFIVPSLGHKKSVFIGLSCSLFGSIMLAFANQGWMVYVILIPSMFGFIARPAFQSIISSHVPPNEQGQLQGIMSGMMSLSAIIGPLLMTRLFAYFTSGAAPVYFAGAPFIMSALLTIVVMILCLKLLEQPTAQ